jgi:hypothetical protein
VEKIDMQQATPVEKNSCHDLANSLCYAGEGSAIMALILNVLTTLHELLVPSKHSSS